MEPASFLVETEGKNNAASWFETSLQQRLDRRPIYTSQRWQRGSESDSLQNANQAAFVVRASTAPDALPFSIFVSYTGRIDCPRNELTIEVARVRRMSPLIHSVRVDRDDVLVSSQKEGLQRRVRALPRVNQAPGVDFCELKCRVTKYEIASGN